MPGYRCFVMITAFVAAVLRMAPILYMTSLSPPSRGVLMTAKALELELELRNVDLTKGENRSPEYLKINPLHTVPTLVDNGVVITDSHAINSYLVQKYGKNDTLYPKDCTKRALVDQKLFFDAEHLFYLFRNAVAPIFFRKTKEVSEEQAIKIVESYKLLETFLANQEWMAGDNITIADISLVTSTTALDLLVPLDSSKFPKVAAWVKRFETLPWAKVNEPGLQILREILQKLMLL